MDPMKEKMGIIGFTGQFRNNPMVLSEAGKVVIFDHALSNVHSCYNTSTGVFTAPRSGVYSLYFSGVTASSDLEGYADLVVEKCGNGWPLMKIFLRCAADVYWGSQGSFHCRCKLERGEQVQVRHVKGDLGLKGHAGTTFSVVFEWEYPESTLNVPPFK